MKFESQKYKIYNLLEEMNNSIVDSGFDFVDYEIKPVGGISYDVYPIKQGNRTIQVGKYIGELPFELEIKAIYKDSLIYNTYYVSDEGLKKDISVYRQCQAMAKILDLEGTYSSGNEHLFSLVQTSISNRVLSKYTAFLALEPGIQEPCFNCEDESISTVNVTYHDLDEIILSACPNPFINRVNIKIKGVYNATDVEKTELIDLTGRGIPLVLNWTHVEDGLSADFDDSNLQSGMYLLRITIKGKVYVLKLIKV